MNPSETNRELYQESITQLTAALIDLMDISPVPLTEIDDTLETLDIRTTDSEYAKTWEQICDIVTEHLSEPTTAHHALNQYNDDNKLTISSIYPLSGPKTTYVCLRVQYSPAGHCTVHSFHRSDSAEPLEEFLPALAIDQLTEEKITTVRDRILNHWG